MVLSRRDWETVLMKEVGRSSNSPGDSGFPLFSSQAIPKSKIQNRKSKIQTGAEGIEPPTCRFGDGCSAN
jgi:hypothetical protein